MNGARLMRHISEKGFQAGSLVGCVIVMPILAYKLRIWEAGALAGATPKLLSALGKSALWGVTGVTIMGIGRVASIPADERPAGLQDRAYRLHYNRGQNRVDMMSRIGMATGGAAALTLVSPAAAVVLGGAAMGSAAGVLTHVLSYKAPEK